MGVKPDFYCPGCRNSLTKSDAMYVLEMNQRSGGDYHSLTSVETVTCPACGCAIPVAEIIAGKHYWLEGPISGILGILLFFAIVFGLVHWVSSCS